MSDNVFSGSDVLDDLYGDIEFSKDDLTPRASREVNKAGWYHGGVLAMKEESPDHEGKNSVVRLDIQVLAGDHPDQKDAMYHHRVRKYKVLKDKAGNPIGREPYSKEYVAQQMRVASGLGLIPRDGGVKFSQVPWANAVGAQTVFKIDADKDTYEKDGEKKEITRYQVNFGNFHRPDDPEVEKVPKDGEALAYLTGGQGVGGADISDL